MVPDPAGAALSRGSVGKVKAENGTFDKRKDLCVNFVRIRSDRIFPVLSEKGRIRVTLAQRGRGCMLTVSNSYADGASVDYSRFFERFYRQDTSHNTDRGGYGIGLSIAENIVTEQYRGRIQASWKNGEITFTCQLRAHA